MIRRYSDNIYANFVDALTTATNGTAQNVAGYLGGAVELLVTTAASTGTVTVQLQVSANGTSGWTNFGSAQVYGAGLTNALYMLDFNTADMQNTLAGASYLRIVTSAPTGSFAVDSIYHLITPAFRPPTQTNTPVFIGHTL